MCRVFLFLAVTGIGGCADIHLSDDYGRRAKAALQAQAEAGGTGESMIDAEDAKIILLRHRNKLQPAGVGQPAGGALTTPAVLGAGGGTMTPGGGSVIAPIKLESVR
jgi:hypothetical protein